MITWTPDPEARPKKAKKRSRSPSVTADEDGEASLTETGSQGSQPRVKKAKINSGFKRVRRLKSTKRKARAIGQPTPEPSRSDETLCRANAGPLPRVLQITPSDDMNQKSSVYTDSSLNTSFNSTDSTFDDFDEPWFEPVPFLGTTQNFRYDEYQTYQRPVQVHSVYNVAQPRFESTPMPMVRPMDLALNTNSCGAICPQIHDQRIDHDFSTLPYGNFRAYHPSLRQMTFNEHGEHSQMATNEHERDIHFRQLSQEQGSYLPLNEYQQAYSSQAYPANMLAPAGISFGHVHDAELRHPHGGLPMQQQEHADFNYVASQRLDASVYHGFNGHSGGTGKFSGDSFHIC